MLPGVVGSNVALFYSGGYTQSGGKVSNILSVSFRLRTPQLVVKVSYM
jgi:hypothetical protein